MKPKVFFVLLMFALLVFMVGCEDDELSIEEVLLETIDATGNINATAFEMEMTQQYNMPGMEDMAITSSASGKAIENPMEAEFDIDMDVMGETVNMKMYLVDDLLYMNIPELGWVWVDISEEVIYAETYEDPFEYINMMQELSPDSVSMEEDDDHYILTYTDDAGELAALLEKEVEAQLKADLFGDVAADVDDLIGAIEFSDMFYEVTVDAETFLPVENTIAFNTALETMGQSINMDQEVKMTYLEFDTFDRIDVPEKVIDEAVAMEELY